MADYGANYTDQELVKLEKRIKKVYREAAKDIETKMNSFTAKSKAKEQKYLQQVKDGKMTQAEFDRWKAGQVFQGKQWQAKKEEIATVLYNANTVASNMANNTQFNVFATNANFASYQMEHDAGVNFGFVLYDQNTVSRLIEEEPNLLPNYKPKKSKDMTWNRKKITNQITQSIIQGEPLNKISKRLATVTASQNMNSMKTHARTLMTSAQNAGRLNSYKNAQNIGIDVEKEWMATLDNHTRDSHASLDGEIVPIDKPFSNGLMYPGDPDGAPTECYNCRCTMVSEIKKYPSSYNRYDNIDGKRIDNMSYEEWKKAKGMENKSKSAVINGKDISATWQRRPDKFDFEIEDVINTQGFDGLPKVVSADEFDKYVQESNLFFQRVYSTSNEDQEGTLKAYQDQLYNGKWHVDCSKGGSVYGQGMYCGMSKSNTEDLQCASTIVRYADTDKNIVETLTLTKDAKIITYGNLKEMFDNDNNQRVDDIGSYAVLKGYDCITECGKNNYAVVLNRTKCIFKDGADIQDFDSIRNNWLKYKNGE